LRLLLRFRDTNSLVKYLREELDKLSIAKNQLEKGLEAGILVDIVEIKNGDLIVSRDRITEFNYVLTEINSRIDMINALLEELQSRLGEDNYTGLVLLELIDGVPQRVLLSQPLMLG